MPNRHARDKRKTAGVRGVSPVGGKVEERICGKDELSLEWKRRVK